VVEVMVLGQPVMPVSLRRFQAGDESALLELVNADRLPGQPEARPSMLAMALHAPSGMRPGWSDLAPPSTDVLIDARGDVFGAVSYAERTTDRVGMLLWLHCHEDDRLLADRLVARVLGRFEGRPVRAFELATPLTSGVRGLPTGNRPGTRTALKSVGFAGHSLGHYLHLHLSRHLATEPCTYPVAQSSPSTDPDGWRLRLRDTDGTVLGEAALGRPVDACSVLWWIGIVDPTQRGKGLGRTLLSQALSVLAENGAREVTALLGSSADRHSEAERATAEHVLRKAGFTEVDRLFCFTRYPGNQAADPQQVERAEREPASAADQLAGPRRALDVPAAPGSCLIPSGGFTRPGSGTGAGPRGRRGAPARRRG
jgi:GNAT superfamily N-acetyltransferase